MEDSHDEFLLVIQAWDINSLDSIRGFPFIILHGIRVLGYQALHGFKTNGT